MRIDTALRGIAGFFVLVSVALGYRVNPWWFVFTVFVGLNLVQSAFTGFCPAEIILHQLGLGKDACGVQPEKRS